MPTPTPAGSGGDAARAPGAGTGGQDAPPAGGGGDAPPAPPPAGGGGGGVDAGLFAEMLESLPAGVVSQLAAAAPPAVVQPGFLEVELPGWEPAGMDRADGAAAAGEPVPSVVAPSYGESLEALRAEGYGGRAQGVRDGYSSGPVSAAAGSLPADEGEWTGEDWTAYFAGLEGRDTEDEADQLVAQARGFMAERGLDSALAGDVEACYQAFKSAARVPGSAGGSLGAGAVEEVQRAVEDVDAALGRLVDVLGGPGTAGAGGSAGAIRAKAAAEDARRALAKARQALRREEDDRYRAARKAERAQERAEWEEEDREPPEPPAEAHEDGARFTDGDGTVWWYSRADDGWIAPYAPGGDGAGAPRRDGDRLADEPGGAQRVWSAADGAWLQGPPYVRADGMRWDGQGWVHAAGDWDPDGGRWWDGDGWRNEVGVNDPSLGPSLRYVRYVRDDRGSRSGGDGVDGGGAWHTEYAEDREKGPWYGRDAALALVPPAPSGGRPEGTYDGEKYTHAGGTDVWSTMGGAWLKGPPYVRADGMRWDGQGWVHTRPRVVVDDAYVSQTQQSYDKELATLLKSDVKGLKKGETASCGFFQWGRGSDPAEMTCFAPRHLPSSRVIAAESGGSVLYPESGRITFDKGALGITLKVQGGRSPDKCLAYVKRSMAKLGLRTVWSEASDQPADELLQARRSDYEQRFRSTLRVFMRRELLGGGPPAQEERTLELSFYQWGRKKTPAELTCFEATTLESDRTYTEKRRSLAGPVEGRMTLVVRPPAEGTTDQAASLRVEGGYSAKVCADLVLGIAKDETSFLKITVEVAGEKTQ